MMKAKVVIRGTRPLLWHRFGPEAIPLERMERTGVAGNDPDEWRKTHSATDKGQLYVDGTYIFGCLRDGAKYVKKGRGSIQKDVAATLQVLNDRTLVDRFMPSDGDPPVGDLRALVYIDVQSVRNPATKGRNVRYRVAASPGWKAEFEILWDETIVGGQQMHSVAIEAGRFAGIGDGRAVGFGRFEVEEFKTEKVKRGA